MDRLIKKITYFNNYYVYRIGIGTRIPISEFNKININTAEYADAVDDRFDIIINPTTDSILISFEGEED